MACDTPYDGRPEHDDYGSGVPLFEGTVDIVRELRTYRRVVESQNQSSKRPCPRPANAREESEPDKRAKSEGSVSGTEDAHKGLVVSGDIAKDLPTNEHKVAIYKNKAIPEKIVDEIVLADPIELRLKGEKAMRQSHQHMQPLVSCSCCSRGIDRMAGCQRLGCLRESPSLHSRTFAKTNSWKFEPTGR